LAFPPPPPPVDVNVEKDEFTPALPVVVEPAPPAPIVTEKLVPVCKTGADSAVEFAPESSPTTELRYPPAPPPPPEPPPPPPPPAIIRYSRLKLTGTNHLIFPVPAVIVVTLFPDTVAVVPVKPAPKFKEKVFG
jgi:hypothetical protein